MKKFSIIILFACISGVFLFSQCNQKSDENQSLPKESQKTDFDDELKAIFAYLKTTKPIKNIVPPPVPPVSAQP